MLEKKAKEANFTIIQNGKIEKNTLTVVALDASGSMQHQSNCSSPCGTRNCRLPITLCGINKLRDLNLKRESFAFFTFGHSHSPRVPLSFEEFKKYSEPNKFSHTTKASAFAGIFEFIENQNQPVSFIFIGDGEFDSPHELKPYLEKANFKNIISVTLVFPKGSSQRDINLLQNDVGDVLRYVEERESRAIPLNSYNLNESSQLEVILNSNLTCTSYDVPSEHFDLFGICTLHKQALASYFAEKLQENPEIAEKLRGKHLSILQTNPSVVLTIAKDADGNDKPVLNRLFGVLHNALVRVFKQPFLDQVSVIKSRSIGRNTEILAILLREVKLDPEEFNNIINPLKKVAIGKLVFSINETIEQLVDAQKNWSLYPMEKVMEGIVAAKPYFTKKLDEPGMFVVEDPGKMNLHALQTIFAQKGPILIEGPPLLFIVCYLLTCGVELEECVVNMLLNFVTHPSFLKQIGLKGDVMEIPSSLFTPPMAFVVMKTLHMYDSQIFSRNQPVRDMILRELKPIHDVIATHSAFNKLASQKRITIKKVFPQYPNCIGCICLVGAFAKDPQPNLPSIVVTMREISGNTFECIYLDRDYLRGIKGGRDTFMIGLNDLTFLSCSLFPTFIQTYTDVLKNPIIEKVHRALNKMYHDGKNALLGDEMRLGAQLNKELLEKNIVAMSDLIPLDCKYPAIVDTEVTIEIPKPLLAKIVSSGLGLPNMEVMFKTFAIKMYTDFANALVMGPKDVSPVSFPYDFSRKVYTIEVTTDLIQVIMQQYVEIRCGIENACPCVSKTTEFECMICYCDCSKNEYRYRCGHFFCNECHGQYQQVPISGELFKSATWTCPYCRAVHLPPDSPTNVKKFFNSYPLGTPSGHAARCCEKCEAIFASPLSCGNDPENIPKRCDLCTPLDGITHCPECEAPYLREGGCDHMTCPNNECGIHFCHHCQYKIAGIDYLTDEEVFDWLEGHFWKCNHDCDDDYLLEEYGNHGRDNSYDSDSY